MFSLKRKLRVQVKHTEQGCQITRDGVTLLSPTPNFVNFGLSRFKDKWLRYFNIDKHDVCLDVGACIGDTTIPMVMQTRSLVIAIEPEPVNLHYLKLNVQGYRNVQVIGKAAFNKKGTFTLHGKGAVTDHSLTYVESPVTCTVEADTLDNILDGRQVDFAKIDVQGAEPEVLEGAPQFLASVKKLCVFIHDRTLPTSTYNAVKQYLDGFNVQFCQDNGVLYANR